MTKDLNDILKPIQHKGKALNQQETHSSTGVKHHRSSTFIENKDILVKGECDNDDESRGALLVFLDLKTGEVRGTRVWLHYD